MARKRPEGKAGQTQILSRQFCTNAEYLISSSSTVRFNEKVA